MSRSTAVFFVALAFAGSFRLKAEATRVAWARGFRLQAEGQQPIFRSGVELVRFDLRVTDADGRPVTDLRPDEVQIVEDGKVRPLLLFQHIQEPAGAYADAAMRAVSAEVTTNRGTPRGHLYMLIFDQQHIAAGNEQIARRAAEAFIRTRVRPSDRIAVFGVPGPGPQIGFTADRTRAIAALSKVHGTLERNVKSPAGEMSIQEAYEIASGNERLATEVIGRLSSNLNADVGTAASFTMGGTADRGALRASDDPAAAQRIIQENARFVVAQADSTSRQFLQRMSDLIAQYRDIEGRKTVVLFSEGFHDQNVTRELEQVAAAASESYAVFVAMDLQRRAGDAGQLELPSTDQGMEIQSRLQPLSALAAETDGTLIIDAASHVEAALGRLADQSQDYYLVGFTPSDGATSSRGSYRRVNVRVTRPGARVSARTGYAVPPAVAASDRRRAIDAAIGAPFVQQALRVDYTTYVLRNDDNGRPRVILTLNANLPVRDSQHDAADIVFVVRDTRDGHVAASGTGTMPLPERPDPGAITGTSRYRVQFEVPPGSYLMRAIVREPGGLIGSGDRRLDVRSVTGPDVTTSDLVLGSAEGALPVRAEAYVSDGLGGLIEAYGRSPEQLAGLSVTASLIPARSDQAAITAQADLAETQQTGTGVTRRARFALPLTSIAPGSYVARVRVRAAGEDVADLSRQVEIHAGSAPAATAAQNDLLRFTSRDVLASDIVRRLQTGSRQSTAPASGHVQRGLELFASDRFAEAAGELQQALKLDQTSAGTAFVLGWAWHGAGDERQAIGAWRAAAAIDPTLVPAHLALADAYLKISQPALAQQALRAGLSALPGAVELQVRLAQIEKR